MSFRLVIIFFMAISANAYAGESAYAGDKEFAAGVLACRSVQADEQRLRCYDELTLSFDLEIQGNGSSVTDFFQIEEPRVLLYDSKDAIMIMYLLDEADNVVQNLHRGGSGGGKYLIQKPGKYKVQVNATGAWSLKLKSP